jgi:hypothetical protein
MISTSSSAREGDQVFRRLLVQFLQGDAAVMDDVVVVVRLGRGVDAGLVIDDLGSVLGFDLRLRFRRGFDRRSGTAQGQGLARTFRNSFNGLFGLVVVVGRIGHGVLAHALGRR